MTTPGPIPTPEQKPLPYVPATKDSAADLLNLIDELAGEIRVGQQMGLGDVSIANRIRATFGKEMIEVALAAVPDVPLSEERIAEVDAKRRASRSERAQESTTNDSLWAIYRGAWLDGYERGGIQGHKPYEVRSAEAEEAASRFIDHRSELGPSRSPSSPPRDTPELTAVLREAKRIAEERGCTDGGCFISPPKGQHTNGGCRCADRQPVKGRLVLLFKAVRRLDAALSGDSPSTLSTEDQLHAGLTDSQKKYGLDFPCRCGVVVYYNSLMAKGRRIIESASGNIHDCTAYRPSSQESPETSNG